MDAARGRAVPLGDAARLHRHDRPAGAGARRRTSRSSPAARAYLDGRGALVDAAELLRRRRRRHPRGHPADRQGRRASRSSCYGTLTGARPRRAAAERCRARGGPRERPAPARRGRRDATHRPGGDEPGRGPQGRALAGARRLAALGRARRGRAASALGHEVIAIDVGHDLVARLRDSGARRRVRRAARARRRGRDGAGAARGARHPVHGLGRVGVHPLLGQGAGQARVPRRGPADARLLRVDRRPRSRSSAPPTRCRRSRSASAFPLVVKPARSGSALGIKFAAGRRRRARRAGRRVLLRPEGAARAVTSTAATSRCRCSTASALPIVEAVPGRPRVLRLRRALRDRPHRVRRARPQSAGRAAPRARRSSRSQAYELLGCSRLRAGRPAVRPRLGRAAAPRGQPGAGPDRDVAAPPGGRRGRDLVRAVRQPRARARRPAARRPRRSSRSGRRRGSPRATRGPGTP